MLSRGPPVAKSAQAHLVYGAFSGPTWPLDEATAQYREAIRADPVMSTHTYISDCAFEKGDLSITKAAIYKARPSSIQSLRSRIITVGKIFHSQGNIPIASRSSKKRYGLHPDFPEPRKPAHGPRAIITPL